MTSPSEPTPAQPEGSTDPATAAEASAPPAPPAPPAPSADAQPTEAYAPVGDHPTVAYPSADSQPTEAYPPAGQPAYGQPSYGQPAYGQPVGQPGYGEPAAYGAPATTVSVADRPRGLGWASLGLAIGGLVLVGAAFVPLGWGSVALALVGGLLLLVALVLGIVTLASKKQGGKGLGIAAIALSVLGGILWVVALTVSLVWAGLAMAGASDTGSEPEVSVSEEAGPTDDGADDGSTDDEGEGEGEEAPAGTYDEAAYLEEVRPALIAITQEIDPSVTEEALNQVYTDDTLITIGKGFLIAGDAAKEAFISSTVESSGGVMTEEYAAEFYDIILDAAEKHLVE